MARRTLPLLAALLLLAGIAPAPAQPDRDGQIQAMLDRRAAAVRERSRDAFLATVDPKAAAFRREQAAWFDRMGAVKVEGYELRLNLHRLPELTRPREAARHGVPVVVALVEERFAISGYDERPGLNDLYLTMVQRDGGWLVASDADLDDLGLYSSRQPWDFDDVQAATSEHFLMLVHPDQASYAPELLRLAEEALPDVDRVWKRPWSHRVPIIVPSTRRELERLLGATFDVSNFVAFAVASVERDRGYEAVGVRVILNRENFLRHTAATRRQILAHELLHVATRGASGPFVANFVEEGFAELPNASRTPALDQQVRSGRRDLRLPEDEEFVTGSGEQIYLAYQRALSSVVFIRDSFGLDGLDRFYGALGAARVEPGTPRHHLDRALTEALGLPLDEFERRWAAWAVARAS